MNTPWNTRIKYARELRGLSKSNFARLLKVAPSTTTEWESGHTKGLTDENLVNVCSTLRIRGQWLVYGILPMEATMIHDEWSLVDNGSTEAVPLARLPMLKAVEPVEKAGPPIHAKIAHAFALASPAAQDAMGDICKALVFARGEDLPKLAKMVMEKVLDRSSQPFQELRPDQIKLLELYEAATPLNREFALSALTMPPKKSESHPEGQAI